MDELDGIAHVELEPPKIFDAITFLTQFGPLKREYASEGEFRDNIRDTIRLYLEKNNLAATFQLVTADSESESAPAAHIFGAEFAPDMVLEQNGEAVAAVLVKLVKSNADGLLHAVGRAVVMAHRFPWVLCLILDKGKRQREKRELDHRFRADMWHNRHVRFLFR